MAKRKTSPGRDALMQSFKQLEACIRDGADPRERFGAKTISFPAPGKHPPEAVQKLRASLQMSQAAFADMIGVSRVLVQGWERGVRQPSPLARRLLDMIANDPGRWIDSLYRGGQVQSRA